MKKPTKRWKAITTSASLTRSLYWHTKFMHLQHNHICQTCFIPWYLRIRRGLSTPGDYKLNGLVLSSAGALSLSQHQQRGTHYLPNKDSAVPYRLLRNIWSRYCSPALFSQHNLLSVPLYPRTPRCYRNWFYYYYNYYTVTLCIFGIG